MKLLMPLLVVGTFLLIYFLAGLPAFWEMAAWIAWATLGTWLVAYSIKQEDDE